MPAPLATLPSKQGLKPVPRFGCCPHASPLATLPSKQGLKLVALVFDALSPYIPLATLPSKQGLKRLHQALQSRAGGPLATLPSKQGLKQDRDGWGVPPRSALLLHFHQNKD